MVELASLAAYNLLLHLCLPLYAAVAWRRHRRRGGAGRDILARLLPPGPAARLPAPGALWFHAVSVGEAVAARPLVESFLAGPGARPVFLTATTETGLRALGRFFPGQPAFLFPFDLPFAWHRFLARTRPRAMVCLETEIWPNLLRALRARGIPFILVNGRLSGRSRRRYRRLAFLFRPLMSAWGRYGMRGEREAAWLGELGVPAGRISVTGNLKYDQALAGSVAGPAGELPSFGGPVVVFASLHPGEEAPVLRVAGALRERFPGLNAVFVPRHPERSRLARLLHESGLSWRRLPAGSLPAGEFLLVERFGVLAPLYGSAVGAFVGGSLVPAGGQNMLEPAARGLAVAFGPHTGDFFEEAGFLLERRAARRIGRPEELLDFFTRLLAGDREILAMGARAAEAVRAGAGAAGRCRRLVEEALSDDR